MTDRLLGPVAEPVARARRLVVLPDGPLHRLPLAALVAPGDDDGRWLIETKALSIVASATILGELRRSFAERPRARIAAFGDPLYAAPGPAARNGASAGDRLLVPLPGTRREVIRIGRLFGEGADLWFGAEATEERVLALDRATSIVHLAVHALLDDRFPLESALALAVPSAPGEAGADGLLQAWEIFERLRLDADLVTLSACDSGLGKEVAGEGLLELVRAFQFAGARSVVASLWRVSDESTAELMERFYRHLREGLSTAEALRAAQVELAGAPISGPDGGLIDASHPYHWAAFQVMGDWR